MNSPHSLPAIVNVPDQPLNPPEYGEWTERDKKEAKERLADRIMDGEVWDENLAYRSDMLVDIEVVLTQFYQGKVERDEGMALIREAWDKYIVMYADDQVEHDPDKYCEEER